MGPVWAATNDAKRAPEKQEKKKVMLQETAELFGMDCRLRSAAAAAHHSKKNESSVRTISLKTDLF